MKFRRDGFRSFFTTINREGFNQGGWRRASQSGLIPDTEYEFEVGVVGSDGVLRKVSRTFNTLKDPACQKPPSIGRPVRVVPPKPGNPFEPDPGLPPPLPPAKNITHDSIEIAYHNQCPGAHSTRVTISKASGGRIAEVKEDGAGLGGWRTALARNLEPDTSYPDTSYKVTVSAFGPTAAPASPAAPSARVRTQTCRLSS